MKTKIKRKKKGCIEKKSFGYADLRDLSWRIQGIAHFLKHTEPDAVPNKVELYGIGQILSELGERVMMFADKTEGG